jgi:hypothetical protein
MAKYTVEFTRILFFEEEIEAENESEARDEAFARADQYMIDTDEWTTFNDSIRAWPVTV